MSKFLCANSSVSKSGKPFSFLFKKSGHEAAVKQSNTAAECVAALVPDTNDTRLALVQDKTRENSSISPHPSPVAKRQPSGAAYKPLFSHTNTTNNAHSSSSKNENLVETISADPRLIYKQQVNRPTNTGNRPIQVKPKKW